ncbi:hypothetical protein DMJ13_10595 [halophilic archaeon]|nr:hypothetical protein DMJ13_10595 [halophilic archaeon]
MALAGSLQLLAALPSPARLGFDRTPNPIREEPTATPIRNEGTAIRVPDDLGLGIEIDRETLAKFHVD